ncbi:MAG: hypothetical protein ACE5KM_09680 [Planctomycetaceae bacterium]
MRCLIPATILAAATVSAANAADVFDRHTSAWLKKGIAKGTPLTGLSLRDAARLKTLSADLSSPCVVIRTNDGNITKALVGWGFRRGKGKLVPVLLIERFVTYRQNRGDVAAASGKDVMLFAGFAFNFDIGQVVPAGQGGDVRMRNTGALEPLDKAQLFGLNGSLLPTPKKTTATGGNAISRGFAGVWKVTVDGRWNGEMRLQLGNNGKLSGKYTSSESKSTYDVTGRVASLRHHAKLAIAFDNAKQTVDAYLFTRDKSTMAGTATLGGRRFGFYAVREKRR